MYGPVQRGWIAWELMWLINTESAKRERNRYYAGRRKEDHQGRRYRSCEEVTWLAIIPSACTSGYLGMIYCINASAGWSL